jgi:hypothetical protein
MASGHRAAASLLLSVLASTGSAGAQGVSRPAALEVQVVTGSGPNETRLAIMREGIDRGAIAMPPGLPRTAIEQGIRDALWHPNGRDVALGFQGTTASFVVVFLQQTNGTYVVADVSRVEEANIGAIGPSRTYKVRRTEPIEWLNLRRIEAAGSRYDGAEAIQIRLRTQVWDLKGTRYQGAEPLIILRDGTPLWR